MQAPDTRAIHIVLKVSAVALSRTSSTCCAAVPAFLILVNVFLILVNAFLILVAAFLILVNVFLILVNVFPHS